jgi:hypothetical protein
VAVQKVNYVHAELMEEARDTDSKMAVKFGDNLDLRK